MNMSDRAGEIRPDPLNSPSVANRSEANSTKINPWYPQQQPATTKLGI
jgi:hypothetical protein